MLASSMRPKSDVIHFLSPVPYPDEKRQTTRYPGKLYKQLQQMARRDHRSVNGEIVWLLLLAIEWRTSLTNAMERFEQLGPEEDKPEQPDQGAA